MWQAIVQILGNIQKLFCFDKHLKIKAVAGCPPDYFSKKGQLWGNVLYDWEAMKKDNYSLVGTKNKT